MARKILLLALVSLLLTGCQVAEESYLLPKISAVKAALFVGQAPASQVMTTGQAAPPDEVSHSGSDEVALAAKSQPVAKMMTSIPALNASFVSDNPYAQGRYRVQPGTPVAIQNYAHADAGCNWLGITGQVFDTNGNPVQNVVVNVGGTLASQPVTALGLTGTSPMYGPVAYEVVVSNRPVDSQRTLWVRLSGLDGQPLSSQVDLDTYADCQRNLIVVNFFDASNYHFSYFPIVGNAADIGDSN